MGRKAQTPKAPYLAKGWLENFFQLIKRVRLTNLNGGVVKQYNLTAPGNESKLVSALRFLKVLDEEGKVDEEKIRSLRMEGDQFKTTLQQILREAYSDVFQNLDVEKATASDLRNFFIGSYDFSGMQATAAAVIFSYLCEKAGILVSADIVAFNKQKTRASMDREIEPRAKTPKSTNKEDSSMIVASGPIGDNDYHVSFRGRGLVFNTTLKNKKELDTFIETMKLNCQFNE